MKSLTLTFLFSLLYFWNLQAQNHGTQALMGVYANKISEEKAEKLGFDEVNGSYVTEVMTNTGAENAGLRPFDYIYRIDDRTLQSHQSIRSALSGYQPGDPAMVYFVRDGKEMAQLVTLGTRGANSRRHRGDSADPFLGVKSSHDEVPEDQLGVRVNIIGNSTAEELGLEDADIITKINGYPMVDWHDLGAGIDNLEVGEEIVVTYLRDGEERTVSSPIKSRAATMNHNWQSNDDDEEEEEEEPAIAKEENPRINQSAARFIAEMEDMEIEMEDMPKEDAEEMKRELGIDMPVVQNLEIDALNIFPNPSEGMFNIRFELPNRGTTAIRVFNSNGKMIYANDLGNFSGDFNGRIDLTNNPAGTYFLMVQQEGYSISKKVVVARR